MIFDRIVNAGGSYSLAVSIMNLEGFECQVKEIAIDGVYLEKARFPHLGRSLVLAGGRLDLLVRCPTPGIYQVINDIH